MIAPAKIQSIRMRQAWAARKAGIEAEKSTRFGCPHVVEADFDDIDFRGLFLRLNDRAFGQYVSFRDEG